MKHIGLSFLLKKLHCQKSVIKSWVKNEIDHFILEKLDEKNLSPNEEADKERLLKRISLDITVYHLQWS
jgi:hypothetical protein